MFEIKIRKVIFLNLLLGSFIYVAINALGINLNLNLITASCITFLGIPGAVLIFVLKLILKIF